MFDWLFGNSDRVGRILENASKPLWVVPRWAVEDARTAEIARLQRQLDEAVYALRMIATHEHDCLSASDIARDTLVEVERIGK